MQQKNIKIKVYKYSVFFIIISVALISFLSGLIYLYSDDVFYASFLKNGFDNFIKMNIEHYNKINGRMLVHIIDEIVLFSGKSLFIIINPLMLLSFSYLSAKCINHTKNKEKTFCITAIILFFIMCMPKEIINESVYWITGAMNYTLPAVLTVSMYYALKLNIQNGKNKILLVILCIIAGATTEQGGFISIILSILLVIMQNPQNWSLYHFAPIFCMLGYLSVILAPGTFLRISYTSANGFFNSSFFNKALDNISPLSVYLTGSGGIHALITILILSISFIIFEQKKITPMFFLGIVISAFLLYQKLFNQYDTYICIITSVSSLLFISIWGFIGLYRDKNKDTSIFIIGATLLLCIMLFSPVLGTRILLIPALFLCVAVGGLIIKLENIRIYASVFISVLAVILLPNFIGISISIISLAFYLKKQWLKFSPYLLFLILLIFFIPIVNGYYSNFVILKNNEENIKSAQVSGRLYWDIDLVEPYRHRLFYENSDFAPYFLQGKNLPKDTQVYLVSKIHKPIYFNNVRLKLPSIKEKVMYYPLRDIFEAMGATVIWDNTTYSIVVEFKDTIYIFKDDWHVTKIKNGKTYEFILKNKKETFLCRTYIPQSFVETIFIINEQEDKVLIKLK